MNVLVTGGSGFVGFQLLKELVQTNHKIATITRQKSFDYDSIKIIRGDLSLSEKMCQELIEFEPDVIVHLSWQGIPDYSQEVSRLNLKISMEFFDFILDNTKCNKIIGSGSCWEYGKKLGECNENDLINIDTYFTWAKHSLYQYLLVKSSTKNITLNWFRFFYVYGPGQKQNSLIPSLIKFIGAREIPKINTPMNKNDFVYVGDIARCLTKAIDMNLLSGIYNLGSGNAVSVFEICKIVEDQLNDSKAISNHVLNNGEQQEMVNFWANMDKTTNALNMSCETNLENGIAQHIQSIK